MIFGEGERQGTPPTPHPKPFPCVRMTLSFPDRYLMGTSDGLDRWPFLVSMEPIGVGWWALLCVGGGSPPLRAERGGGASDSPCTHNPHLRTQLEKDR